LIIPGVLAEIAGACDFVADAANDAGIGERGAYHCQLAVDEWCTNIIEHGYKGKAAHAHIEIVLRLQPGQITITLRDEAPPFDPTTLAPPDPNASLEARERGGLGWFFIKKVMSSVVYRYNGTQNVLLMVKREENSQPMSQPTPAPFPVIVRTDGVLVASPNGRIDSAISNQVEESLRQQIDAGFRRLVIDMAQVSYISSMGLKMMLGVRRKIEQAEGHLALANLGPRVYETFEMSGFHTLFTIAASVDAAAAEVAG
jgi:anti-anti-sigma factor